MIPRPLSTYSEHDSTNPSFQSIGPFLANDVRTRLRLVIGCDADAVIAFYPALVKSNAKSRAELITGTNIIATSSEVYGGINGIKFLVRTGQSRSFDLPLPVVADNQARQVLCMMTGSVAPVHISMLMSIEMGSQQTVVVPGAGS